MHNLDGGVGATPHIEPRDQLEIARCGHGHEIVTNAIGHGLVEGAQVPEAPDVELEALQFQATLVRDVPEVQMGEVGLAGLGTQAGELRNGDMDEVIPLHCGVGKGFQTLGQGGGHRAFLTAATPFA